MSFSTENSFFQVDAYPWIAALLRDEDIAADYINSKCAAVIVSTSSNISSYLSLFINGFVSTKLVIFPGYPPFRLATDLP